MPDFCSFKVSPFGKKALRVNMYCCSREENKGVFLSFSIGGWLFLTVDLVEGKNPGSHGTVSFPEDLCIHETKQGKCGRWFDC